ncbi:type II secretion system major pseudopilin GspG [Legionella longbeachae]|uniref:Homologous to type II secretory pathway protein LspG n=1 Tax=Legionella longbeachae serogroup 1 (strain NSW150) TaxID=661367 RepID=D3HP97_LEGLN|nr:type II secretion system major pseudopilin GspG [Legionella longbeachae]VEE01236.1 Homologous to type II secretory pathway protein LspG [Legionella oakridgensis]HBD7398327.1 type II secretion system major pseudopilin GspG [Legionella pneumophila]ARB92395.1 type II secretion system protein GspG [Legionella longbeachae]ARM34424.1 type II secretion system protein GspG [Legionella longbeachae]EEZ96288.1 general secretion pathway protein G [Legionella longbeachae D-4968]
MERIQTKNGVRKSTGATVIEIMLMIMLLVIFIAIILSIYLHFDWKKSPEAIKEEQDVLIIENAMKFYKLDNGFYPSNTQGIAALIQKPVTEPVPQNWIRYLDKIPNDPWGFAYRYSNPGRFSAIEIYSCGPTQKLGTWAKIKYWLTSSPKINCK